MKRNERAICGNCPFWEEGYIDSKHMGRCVRMPCAHHKVPVPTAYTGYCGQHPDFFAWEWEGETPAASPRENIAIVDMARDWLNERGYTGLLHEYHGCGCDLLDLMPCTAPDIHECIAGYRRFCTHCRAEYTYAEQHGACPECGGAHE